MRTFRALVALLFAVAAPGGWAQAGTPMQPFAPDAHTMLLYHFDEGSGTVLHDSSGHGYDAEIRGPRWAPGRFGGALSFDGVKDCCFRPVPAAIQNLKQITVECWLNQDAQDGRRFMAGQDVGFHFEVDDGVATSISLYNKGGSVPNAEGRPHQQVLTQLGPIRPGRWHHDAITYDGQFVSFFFDGVLRQRVQAVKDFSLGAPARGFWLGCYIGTDFFFSGRIDEFRVSDCVRYDPERKLNAGERIFDMPQPVHPVAAVRVPKATGAAALELTLKKLYGGDTAGWVRLKPPGQKAVIVGRYELKGLAAGAQAHLQLDVSDEAAGQGCYILGLEPTDAGGYFAVTEATLKAGGRTQAVWRGEARSRCTFQPPILIPLQVGASVGQVTRPVTSSFLLLPSNADRLGGQLQVDEGEPGDLPVLAGDGTAEWWLNTPVANTYRVHMRYATTAWRPCDVVIDGEDLNDFNMCARNRTPGSGTKDALWEYQGQVTLGPGLHWLRVQDVLPDIVALRLDPARPAWRKVAWERYPVPEGDFLQHLRNSAATVVPWPPDAWLFRLLQWAGGPDWRFSVEYPKTDPADIITSERAVLGHAGAWDLEPFGRLRFKFRGYGSGHVISLRLVDAKGDEKLIWRKRDTEADTQDVSVPLDFEGNDVFDPGHVREIDLDLDEGNVRAPEASRFEVVIISPVFDRRDALVEAPGLAQEVARAESRLVDFLARPELRAAVHPEALTCAGFQPWTKPVVPEAHPLFAGTEPKPVTRRTLGYELHFTGARDISPGTLDDFHKFYDFGDICWPHIGILPQRRDHPDAAAYQRALADMEQRLREVNRRGLILWDIWGYVPFGEAGPTPQVKPEHHQALLRVFGDRFLGYDNGEQDGRYIGSYSDRGTFTTRRGGWDDFVRWDQGICNDSMNYMDSIGSLNFSLYYGERGCRILGLETAQGLPSDTLEFAFLRGASKEYGRLTSQGTSIWSRFGYNMYQDRRTDGANGYGLGPHKGCSLSLHRRLFFAGYTGGDSIVGSETSQFTADRLESGAPELSPLGRQHLEIRDFARRHPDRGVLYTPVAFMLDFYNGWNPPRHLYRADKYKIWGKLPYEKGDYLTDAVFRMVWPGYEDASYLRNERGFVTPTPFGDIFDVVNNRCHPEVLKHYQALMLLGEVGLSPEVVANFRGFVEAGGDLILDAGNARALPPDLTGVTFGPEAHGLFSHSLVTGESFAEQPYTYVVLSPVSAHALLVSEAGHPLMTVNAVGKGRVIVGAPDRWMTDKLTYRAPEIVNMEPPYRLLRGVQATLAVYFGSFSPVTTAPGGLNVRTCCFDGDPKRLLVSLTNNELFSDWRGAVQVRLGQVASARELRSGREWPVGRDEVRGLVPAGEVAILDLRLR